MLTVFVLFGITRPVGWAANDRRMGGMKPDHHKKGRLLLDRSLDERQGLVHNDATVTPNQAFSRAIDDVATVVPIQRSRIRPAVGIVLVVGVPGGDGILRSEPFVKACHVWRHVVFLGFSSLALAGEVRRHGAQVPLPKVAGGIPPFLHDLRQTDFLAFQVSHVSRFNAVAIGIASSQDRATCRTAYRSTGIEAIESQAVACHVVQMGCLNDGVAVVPGVAPTQIVGPAQDDCRLLGGRGSRRCDQSYGNNPG